MLPILVAAGNALRVPALVGFLASIFGSMVGWFAQWFSKKTAIQLGIVAAVVSLTIALFGAIQLIVAGISIVIPDFVQQGIDMVIPSNFLPCVSAVVSAKVVRWVWIWKVHFIELYANT